MSTTVATESPTRREAPLPADASSCARRLQTTTHALGLSRSQLLQLLGASSEADAAALDYLLERGAPVSRHVLRDVLERLEDRLGTDLGSPRLASRFARIARRVADIFGALVGAVSAYIVVGGLIEGDSLLLGDAGPVGLLLFALVLALLATFEALHVSATMLKIADLGGLAAEYPRAAKLHRRFRTDSGLARFLAGRQLVVIVTVFFCSGLSSFPDLEQWPFTDVALPSVLVPLVTVGMPGALFVLWFGQLLPQFLATRHAVQLTDSRFIGLAFKAAYALEAIGLARVGFWAASWDHATERIPASASLRWQDAAEELDGYGAIGLTREWTVAEDRAQLHATSSLRMYADGASSVVDGSLLVPGAPARLALTAEGRRGAAGEPLPLAPTQHREESLPTGDKRFHKPLISAIGSFKRGDLLRIELDAEYGTGVQQDLVFVDRPVRFVVCRVSPTNHPRIMSAGVVRQFSVGDGLGDLTEAAPPLRIEPTEGPDGLPEIRYLVEFPPPKTLLVFDWEVES